MSKHSLAIAIRAALLLGLNEAPVFYPCHGKMFVLANDPFAVKEENQQSKTPTNPLVGLTYSFTWITPYIY
jgi:hypothetical protein